MKNGLFIPACLWLLAPNISTAEISADLRITGDYTHFDNASLYAVPDTFIARSIPQAEKSSEQNLELRWQKGGFNSTLTLRNRATEHAKPHNESFFNELYYDTQMAGQDMSLGRKITSWGVGFGFRPLDVIQQEDRRELYKNTLRGVDLLAWEKFYESAALSLLWSNPGKGETADYNELNENESLALKYYNNLDDKDVHVVARLSERSGAQLGIGLSSVPNESLEWHGSLLWQQDYTKRINSLTASITPAIPATPANNTPLSVNNPFKEQNFHDGIKALAGVGWTHSSGWGILGEVWFDETAYSKQQWQDLNTLTATQRQLLDSSNLPHQAILGNIAYNQQAFLQDNLQQWNTLIRLSRQGKSLEPALELLYTPEDQGWVSTAKLDYKLDKQKLEAGLRVFGGADESAYSLLPQDKQFFISWQGSF